MEIQGRTSYVLALLCFLLVSGIDTADKQKDDYDIMPSDDANIMPADWASAFEQLKDKVGFGRKPVENPTKQEEKRVFSGGSDPSFRKTNSYVKSSSGSYSSGGVKTGGRQAAPMLSSECIGEPPIPVNSKLKCTTYSGCSATCLKDYQFPNGERRVFITCVDKVWQVQGSGWNSIPHCEPICLPECQHNGICIAPGQCNCPENFSGPQCQFENKPCLNFPPTPMNAMRTCNSKSCTIQCAAGHKFPGGIGVTNLLCRNGVWVPSKPEWISVPDCEPECNPTCENNGRCMSFNKCQCPTDFRGPQCQYGVDQCTMEKMNFNGGRNCTGNSETFTCSISCPVGIQFEFPPAPRYICSYSTGIFLPETIPQCKYGDNMIVRTVKGPTHTFRYNSTGSRQSSSFSGSGVKSSYKKGGSGGHSYGGITHGSSSSMEDLIAKFHSGTSQLTVLESKKSEPGTCFTYGGSHYKTFDGKLYSFQSQCSYTLVKDSVDNTFTINLETSSACLKDKTKSCHKKLRIFLENKEFVLTLNDEGKPELTQAQNIVIPSPSQLSELSIQRVHHVVMLKLNGVGVTINWDTKNFVQVDITEQLWNKTVGLCGRIDGHSINDFEKKDGKLEKTILPFIASWEVDSLGDQCNEVATDEHPCGDTSSAEETLTTNANKFCSKMLEDPRFSICQDKHAKEFYETCRWDYCAAKNDNAETKACEAISIFFQECMKGQGSLSSNWRDETFCPMSCSNGTVYKQCGPAVQATCSSASVTTQKAEICVEGCYCPGGTVLNNDTCVPIEQCPCQYRGKTFTSGSKLTKGCNTCSCSGGQWQCTQVLCGARCSAIGDPHYVTFDGKRFDFMGQCSYYLVKTNNFTIEAENVACAGAISESLGFSLGNSGLPSCTKALTVNMGKTTIKLKQNRAVVLNGEEITQLPRQVEGINIRVLSSIFLIVELPNGVEIWWDGVTRAYIDVPATLHGQTQGLCGTFNENQKDDFLTPEGDIEQSIDNFANKWKTQDLCPDVVQKELVNHPCDKNMQNKGTAETHCKKLKGKLFSACHWLVDVEPFYQDCLFDVCSCEGKIGSCLCPVFSAYAKECAQNGAIVDWRHEIRECGVHCMSSQRYQVCGDSCSHSCKDISLNPRCKTQCVEGCNCPEGQTLDKNGECIQVSECPCIYNNEEFAAGHREIRTGVDGLDLCICEKSKWKCHAATTEEIKEYPQSRNVNELKECSFVKNLEFTKCESAEPVTCKNMHEPPSSSPAVCRPGCQCRKGFVLDTVTKECIKPSSCPCHHGGKSYGEGESIQENCNVCTCNAGSWKCTDRGCAGICTAWGESHFKSFDGKIYDFHGTCDYMLASGKSSASEAFEVTVQNVLCGSGGVTCAKSVTIRVGSGNETESIVLTKDKPVPTFIGFNRTTVRQAGLFVFVEVFDLGLVVQWDRGTRVYVKIDPKWKNRLRGLCGNYNDNELDDFQTPSGGLSEVSAKIFGDSWRLQEHCMESVEILDTCELHPSRKTWAMQKCGVLKSEIFKSCHSEVPVGPYIERCMFDTCGCDLGGDCECLCTAIATYAQECNIHGVPIKWRTQELCPIQCDETCAHYSPCVATCPHETCDNMFVYKSMTQLCSEDACVEGCQLKSCNKGEIYNSLEDLKCIPKSTCKPTCMIIDNKIYYEGETISGDDCHTCSCSRHKKVCQGLPCTTSTTPEIMTTPAYETIPPVSESYPYTIQNYAQCHHGWSTWMNNDQPIGKKNSKRKQNDIESLERNGVKNLGLSLPCAKHEMVDIRCRTVGSHLSPKETGQDVECSLERGLVCKGTAFEPCHDYEIQVKCQCETPSTEHWEEITQTSEITTPAVSDESEPTCLPGWTKWFDQSKPDRNGEFETTHLLRQSYSFCPNHMIIDTECRVANSHEPSLLDVHAKCDKEGLHCKNTGRGDMMCQNYEVRFLCSCECQSGLGMESGLIDDSQISVSSYKSPLTLGNHARLNGQGAWIPANSAKQWIQVSFDEPKHLTGIDIQGNPRQKEWVEAFTVSWSNDGEGWKQIYEKDTNWPKKLKGNKDQNSIVRTFFPEAVVAQYIRIEPSFFHGAPALRFEILGCDTEVKTTKLISTSTSTTTTPATTPNVPSCVPDWSEWFNQTHPDGDDGDYEHLDDIREAGVQICDQTYIKDIECRYYDEESKKLKHHKESGDYGVTCKKSTGLTCINAQQLTFMCQDYAIRVFCECEEVPVVTKSTPSTTIPTTIITTEASTTTSRCPPGQEWQECAIACDQVCLSYENDLKQKGYCLSQDDCKPGCVETICGVGHRWRSEHQCVHTSDCTCVSKNGTLVKPGIVYHEDECNLCQCINNKFVCDASLCETTTEPEFITITYGPPSPLPNDTQLGCYEGWSVWRSQSNLLNNEEGDIEGIKDFKTCNPTAIECKTVRDSIFWNETGQVVTCDLVNGLECYNNYNIPEGCRDYEIRVYCSCHATTQPPTTKLTTVELVTTPPTTTETTPVPCDNWSQWFNDNSPQDEVFEWESKSDYDLKQLGFCTTGELTAIECVDALNETPYTDTGDTDVNCNLNNGLKCYSEQEFENSCKDYKIRYYCSCEKATTPSFVTIAPTTVSPPPPCDEQKLLSLVNSAVLLPDSAFKASSSLNSMFGPHHARIETNTKKGVKTSWVAKSDDKNQFLQIDLGQEAPVYGVVVQGNPATQQYVTSYQVMYSTNGIVFSEVTDLDGKTQTFSGPNDAVKSTKQIFKLPFEAKFVRFVPLTWKKGIAMKVDVLGCGEMSDVTYTETYVTVGVNAIVEVLCDDVMGFENGKLDDQQILVSSVLDGNLIKNGPKNIRLNAESAWRPNENGVHEWVLVDFLEPRNVSGFITQGDENNNAWVETFTVKYSSDNINWNPILDKNANEKVFLANFDTSNPIRNDLERMIHSQYLKIIPQTWHKSIGLRLEVIGCYLEYPYVPEVTTIPPPPVECNACPNLPTEKLEGCMCGDGLLWNGDSCVSRSECDCYVGHIPYVAGTVYETEECHKCVCKIGGMAECDLKTCAKCENDLQSILTPLCGCICKPCPEGTRLCHTSNVCLNETQWCDGIEDCSDDERECTTVPITSTTPIPTPEPCPPAPPCEDGTLVKIEPTQEEREIPAGIKKGVKGGRKGGVKGGAKSRNPKRITVECPQYICEHLETTVAPCPEPHCPEGYDVIKSSVLKNNCPEFRCELPPKDQVCKVDGRNFKTFDETKYQYEICNHILAQDKINKEWKISVHKICSEVNLCKRQITIKQAKHLLTIRPDLSIEYDGYTFTVAQAQTIGSKHKEFTISHVGNTIYFESHHYGFTVVVDDQGNFKITAPAKLYDQINGLCGHYNGIQEDDKTNPDGTLSRSTVEFGDNWIVPGTSKEECEEVICAEKHQDKAYKICKAITAKKPLSLCDEVISIEHFTASCIEGMCKCLQHDTEENCKCETALAFMRECQEDAPQFDLSSWRVENDCPASCPPGLVYKDCFKNQCERSCENLHDKDPCPKLENTCFSGCYCPDGLVRKGEKCVKPVECKDCVCTGFGDPQYLTFDRTNYTFNGNCTYVASRDIINSHSNNKKHDFEVLVTNIECIEEPGTTCTEAVTVLYEGNIVHVKRVEGKKQILTHLNGELVTTFPLQNDWLKLETVPKKHVTIFIPEIQLEVAYFYFNYAFVVRLPSHIYGNKTEGLCGDCNKNKTDDCKMRNGILTNNTDDFGLSWLVKDLPPGLKLEERCLIHKNESCLPLPPDEDPCLWIMDEAKFGQCHKIVDPESYIISCQFDVCHSLNKRISACRDVEAYARECQQHGLCLDWRSDGLCPYECPTGTIYKACGSGCEETCDNYEQYRKNSNECGLEVTEGCYCPEGQVFKNDICVPENKCKPCDVDGLHYLGDEWKPDNCTSCKCSADRNNETSIECIKTECPAVETICKQGFTPELVPGSEGDCCAKYLCMEEHVRLSCPLVLTTPQCGPFQKLVDISQTDCPNIICQCVAREECPPVSPDYIDPELDLEVSPLDFGAAPDSFDVDDNSRQKTSSLEPGMVRYINETGCCPHYSTRCDKTTCPKIECKKHLEVRVVPGTETLCCPRMKCVPPEKLCIAEYLYTASEQGGEKLRPEEENESVLKEIGATWKDGPCRSCICVKANSPKDAPSVQCNAMTCSTVEQNSDFKHYILDQSTKFGECCPSFKRIACQDDGQEYQVGKEWPVPGDKCATEMCLQLNDGTIEKQTKHQDCHTDCELGWEYFPSPEESPKCCGYCRQVACVQDGKTFQVGTNWFSDDSCTQFFCDTLNGTVQIESVKTSCPDIPKEWVENFILKSYNLPGDCCNTTERVACVDNDKKYQEGESWQSTDDKCKKYECIYDNKQVLQKQEQIEVCNKECKLGWEYVDAKASSDKCCGECVQVSCIVNDEEKKVGESWQSDNCTRHVCENVNNQVTILTENQICPSLGDCESQFIRNSKDGCCKHCSKRTSSNQVNCKAEEMAPDATVSLITEVMEEHGLCVNKDAVPNFKKCVGNCNYSNYTYNSILSTYSTPCTCCQAVSYDSVQVELTCEDEYQYFKYVKIPMSCSCNPCGATSAQLTKKSPHFKSIKNPSTFLDIRDAYN